MVSIYFLVLHSFIHCRKVVVEVMSLYNWSVVFLVRNVVLEHAQKTRCWSRGDFTILYYWSVVFLVRHVVLAHAQKTRCWSRGDVTILYYWSVVFLVCHVVLEHAQKNRCWSRGDVTAPTGLIVFLVPHVVLAHAHKTRCCCRGDVTDITVLLSFLFATWSKRMRRITDVVEVMSLYYWSFVFLVRHMVLEHAQKTKCCSRCDVTATTGLLSFLFATWS